MSTATLRQYIEEGRLIRREWEGEADGRHTACLFVALAGKGKRPRDCPKDLMPKWFAHLTPWIDDAGTEKHWPEVVRRYADLAERWHVLTEKQWQRLEFKVKLIAVEVAMSHTDEKEVLSSCEQVVSLLKKAIAAAAYAAADDCCLCCCCAADDDAAADRMIDKILDALEAEIEGK